MDKLNIKAFFKRCNSVSKIALEGAAGLCVNDTHYEITVEHFLSKLLEVNSDLTWILTHFDISGGAFSQTVQRSLEDMRRGNHNKPVFSQGLSGLLEDAWLIASLELGLSEIRSVAVVLAIVANPRRHGLSEFVDALERVLYDELKNNFLDIVAESSESESSATEVDANSASGMGGEFPQALQKYCVNFTQQARDGSIDPVFCREREIRQMVDILARRRKNNPICVGEAGVGKTSVIEGLALKIVEKDVPEVLHQVEILSLDLSLLQAGASVKGEFENRLNDVISAVKSSTVPIILFIDEAHTLIGAGGAAGSGDAANLLKPALARGELRTIGATTWSEYKKYIEKDPALARRFQLVKLDEPTPEQAAVIMRGLRHVYEKSHGVYIRDDAVQAAAQLSARFINGRQLPDKAVDVLDTAAARVKISLSAKPEKLDGLEQSIHTAHREITALERDIESEVSDEQERLQELKQRAQALEIEQNVLVEQWQAEQNIVNNILQARHLQSAEAGEDSASHGKNHVDINQLKQQLSDIQKEQPLVHYEVSPQVVAEVISSWTGIPIDKMVKDRAQAVLTFADEMQQRIKGQSFAISAIDNGMRAAKARINNPDMPIGVFLLVGPSGVGKTETCIGVADLLFGGERYLTTINMSEFQEKHSVSRLIGSPPGYVGYGEGGVLTEAVRQKPYSVVLLDEVEKADPEVLNLFYQVFDKGMLSDGEGQLVDFKNTMVFLTSNLATETMTAMCARAQQNGEPQPNADAMLQAIRPQLSQYFKPALLARMQIIPYFPIGSEIMREIVELKLGKVQSRIQASHKLSLQYDEQVIENITARCTEVDSGARNADHIINNNLLPQLATDILQRLADDASDTSIRVSLTANGQFVSEFS